MSILHPKGGNIVWVCVKDNIIEGRFQYESIGIRGFDYKLFEKYEGGGIQGVLYGYPYLKNLLQLWTVYLVKHMGKINEAVGENNFLDKSGGEKRSVHNFRRQELCKFTGCILSEVTYGKKGHKRWGLTQIYFGKNPPTKLHRDIFVITYLYKLCCDIYFPH